MRFCLVLRASEGLNAQPLAHVRKAVRFDVVQNICNQPSYRLTRTTESLGLEPTMKDASAFRVCA